MKKNSTFELLFEGEQLQNSQALIDLEATFSWKSANETKQKIKKVKGFYAGNGIYKIRFLPDELGEYEWQVEGCIKAQGKEICVEAKESKTGIVRAEGTHFVYESGEQYIPFGTTIYAMAHQTEMQIAKTLETLKAAPFNKVRHCVFPKSYDYNHNEPELFAFERKEDGTWDVNRPCFAFWNHLENLIKEMAKMGIQSDLILFHPYDHWGFSKLTMEENKVYLDYLLRRFSAIPEIWWSVANEFDLVPDRTLAEWHEIEEFIAENDPYNHLLSNHNCFSFYDFTRKNITHCCVQTTQIEHATQWMEQYQKPVIYDECCYEGNLPLSWGNISGFEMVHRFWAVCVQGAYATHGEVFLADNEILWWSKGGILKGESPKRIAFLRNIIETMPAPIEAWPFDPLSMLDEEMRESVMNSPFAKLFTSLSESEREGHLVKDSNFRGRCGEQVFLHYLGKHCNGILTWDLPENQKYTIEVIDVWEMTKEIVMTGISGRVDIKLPGKEGIAVIARAEA